MTMHSLTKLALAGAALSLTATAAQAQSFTFQATQTKAIATGSTAPDGTPFGGVYSTGTQVIAMADGKKATESYSCIGTTQPPRDAVFQFSTICDSTGPNGDTSSVWGCNFISRERNEVSCVGGIYGKTGAYAGKRGTVTWHGLNGNGPGTGQWNN
jgi:hypothetical protein